MTQSIKHESGGTATSTNQAYVMTCNNHEEAVLVVSTEEKTKCPDCNKAMEQAGWIKYMGGRTDTQ